MSMYVWQTADPGSRLERCSTSAGDPVNVAVAKRKSSSLSPDSDPDLYPRTRGAPAKSDARSVFTSTDDGRQPANGQMVSGGNPWTARVAHVSRASWSCVDGRTVNLLTCSTGSPSVCLCLCLCLRLLWGHACIHVCCAPADVHAGAAVSRSPRTVTNVVPAP